MSRRVEALLWETRRLFRAMAAAADEALAPRGLTAGDRALLEFLVRESGPIPVAELARKRAVSRQHIHQSLARLPNARWIERRPDPEDARAMLLSLTDEGRAAWREIRKVDRRLLRRLARHADSRRLEAATRTLRSLRRTLEGGRDA
jgi:DNA-binding MarR family transcriptional regulator